MKDLKYLELLKNQYNDIDSAGSEIINLKAILNLPKGTEVFLSDLHGEDAAFLHLLKNGSGVIRHKIEELFGASLSKNDKKNLATLIYYPKEVMDIVKSENSELKDWYQVHLNRLILVTRELSSKYTRSKVRKALPHSFSYIIEELLHEQENDVNKTRYYEQIISSIIDIGKADAFILSLCQVIWRLAIDRLHIIGDIFDRGSGAYRIMEKLMDYHAIDIQWGNHDILWMGASSGSLLCIADVLRISARYNNLNTLEEDYGINLVPLVTFAMETYKQVEPIFYPKTNKSLSENDKLMIAKIHKAITIILLKIQKETILRHPEYDMADRILLDKIDYTNKTITIENKTYKLRCNSFPTIDPSDPYKLTAEEDLVLKKLSFTFTHNYTLTKHVDFLFEKGSTYLSFNNNLLFHGCIPTDSDGNFSKIIIEGKSYYGKNLMDKFESITRKNYRNRHSISQGDLDIFWYLWSGKQSPLYGKRHMKTFERYFLSDESTYTEEKNPYYTFVEKQSYCIKVLETFGVDKEKGKIINGHVPVKVKKGENPVKADGKLIVIDGGLSKAYQNVTGIAGYTLIYNSHGMILAAHQPFMSKKASIENNSDIISSLDVIEKSPKRLLVKDTDTGLLLKEKIEDLNDLLEAYRLGIIK